VVDVEETVSDESGSGDADAGGAATEESAAGEGTT
jgi:hypothetical protein